MFKKEILKPICYKKKKNFQKENKKTSQIISFFNSREVNLIIEKNFTPNYNFGKLKFGLFIFIIFIKKQKCFVFE